MSGNRITPYLAGLATGAVSVWGAVLAWAADAPPLVAVVAGAGVYAAIRAAVGTARQVRAWRQS